jgi:RimJ/RimL family protein N-acetyltransferase
MWANDPALRELTGEVLPMSMKRATEFLENLHTEKDRVWFSVVLTENDRLIGEAGLLRMFHPWRTTDLTLIIGEKDCWGKGYGTEAILLLLDYAFGFLNFHRVAVGVVGFNERALHFYKKVGFKKEGIQRDGYYYNHEYHDFVMMSILEDEVQPHR